MRDRIDRTSDRPAYRQIADHLREAIINAELAPGEQLPSERDLIERYAAARGTVRQSLALLRSEGLVLVEHGRGAFVRPRPPIRHLAHDRFARRHRKGGKAAFLAEADAAGYVPEVEVQEVAVTSAPLDIVERLAIRPDDEVLVRRRRYLADGQPVELATSWLPRKLTIDTPIEHHNPGPGGIYARLEELDHRLMRFTEEVTARMPLPDEVRALRLTAGEPVFRLVRTAYDTDDRPVEICDTVMAADRFILSYELPAS